MTEPSSPVLQLMQKSLSDYPASVRWHSPDCDTIVFFPPSSIRCNLNYGSMTEVMKDLFPEFQRCLPSLGVDVDQINGYSFAFNSQHQLPTYESLKNA